MGIKFLYINAFAYCICTLFVVLTVLIRGLELFKFHSNINMRNFAETLCPYEYIYSI